jgi:hypothetical protein
LEFGYNLNYLQSLNKPSTPKKSQCPSRLTVRVSRSCDAEKKLKLSSEVGDIGSKNSNKAMVAPVAESAFGGSLESQGRFCVGAFGSYLPSVAVKMFSHSINVIQNCKFCTFKAICKDNAAITTVQHKKKVHSRQFLRVILR